MILITWTPWYQSRLLARLSYELGRETGLVFDIDQYRQVAPGKLLLQGVAISDPETGDLVATIRMVEYLRENDRVGILLHQPELQSAGLGRAWAVVHDRLISRPEHTIRPIKIAAADLNIHSQSGSLALGDLSATVTPEANGVRLVAEAGSGGGFGGFGRGELLLRCSLFRDRSGDVPRTDLVFSTEGTALPCSVLAEYLPVAKKLGPDAQFVGNVTCQQTANGWSFDFGSPTLMGVELSRCTEDLPHWIRGTADLHLRRCRIEPGRMVDIIGSFQARDVRVGTSLLRALREHTGWLFDETFLDGSNESVECSLAAVDFEITDQTMKLTGICNSMHAAIEPGVALFGSGRAIAKTNPQRFNADRFVAALDPSSRTLAAWNQVFLPSSPTIDATGQPSGQIRRASNWSGGETIQQR
jgi:hypothetical protein